MESRYCTKCGLPLADDVKYCAQCGTKINKKMEISPKFICVCVAVAILIILLLWFSGTGVKFQVRQLLQDDLGSSVTITELYYNKAIDGCLVAFNSEGTSDVAGIYLSTGKIKYYSVFEYYSSMFNWATSQEQRAKYSQKVLEYSDLVNWEFIISCDGATKENGWTKIK